MEVVVEYEYEALHDDELTLRPGDIIKHVRLIEEDGWMEGELHGRRGLFPDNFVKEIKKDSKETKETKHETRPETKPDPKPDPRPDPKEESPAPLLQHREKSSGTVANLVHRMSTIGIPLGGFQPHPPAPVKKTWRRQCRVLFDYQPQNEDELELKTGEVLDVTEEVEEGWWSGTLNGKSGLFPSNFVKEVEPVTEDGDSGETMTDETDGPAPDPLGTPTSPPASGNGALRPPSKVMGVGFGDIFQGGRKPLKPVPSLPSAPKPAPPNHPTPPEKESEGRGSLKRHSKEYCKVTYGFEATNEDELTLKEGDLIHILSKDTGEPGWWRGEVGGREGVFPDNFVVLVNDAEKDSSVMRVPSLKASPKTDPEETPRRRPPPPVKSTGVKPEVPSADRKPLHPKTEERVDKAMPEPKPAKPAPLPPPKPTPPGKNRPVSHPLPRKPDKPVTPSPSLKHNGELPAPRPKADVDALPKPKALSVDLPEKTSEPATDLMSFDDLTATSLKLSHPTADRPKLTGRRPPTQFIAPSPSKEVNVEKCFKTDEEDAAKPKPSDSRKSSSGPTPLSASVLKPGVETKPSSAPPTGGGTDAHVVPSSGGVDSGVSSESAGAPPGGVEGMEELRTQMGDLLLTVQLLKTQHSKEIAELRGELDEERQKRVALQMEIEKLKRAVHST